MKATKRISAIFLALVLALSLLPVSVFAAGSDYSTRLLVDKVADNKVDVKWMVQTSNGAVMKTVNSIIFKYDNTKYDMLTNDGTVITTKTMSDNLFDHYTNSDGDQIVTTINSPSVWNNSGIYTEAKGTNTFVLINLASGSSTKTKEYTTETALAVIHLQLKSGAVDDGLPGGSIALATVVEADGCAQSGIVIFIGAGEEQFIYGRTDSSADTLLTTPAVAPGTGVTFAKPALPSSASVSITGTPKIGETLTATPSGLPSDAGTLTYKWYRDGETSPISGADTGTYTPSVAEDVDKKIKVEVSAANYSGSVTATTTDTVKKADGPAAPTGLAVVSVTDTTITVTPDAAWEYSKNDGSTWQDSNVFTGLAPNNYYSQIVARVKETGTHKAGAKSATISATTTKGSAGADTITKLKATHTPYTGTYDGTAHDAFSVDAAALGALTGWSVAYSTNGTSYGSTMPKVTNVADSGKIYVKFANTSYADVIAEYDVTVSAKDIDGANIVFGTQKTYDGTEQSVVISKVTLDGTDLTGADYTVESGDKATEVGNNTLVIKGKGNYKGTASAKWSLVAKDIGAASVSITLSPTSYDYTGSAITPDPVVKDGATLEKGTDYTVSYSKNTYVGTATLTINGTGNYTGTNTATFTITAVDQNPSFTTPVDLAKGGHMLNLRTLVEDEKGDMTFTIPPATTSATLSGYTLTSTGIKGEVKVSVSITAKDVNGDGTNEYNAFNKSDAITVNVIDKTSDTTTMKVSQGDITYGGSVSPSVTNKPAGTGTVSYTYEGRDGTTYSSSATAPTNVGKYKVTAKCESSTVIYTAEDTFEILPKSISGMTVTLDKTSLEYNGSAQTVNVNSVGSLTAADYTVTSGTSGTDVGSYTVTVTGQGNYKDTATATWKITQATPTYTVPTGLTAKYGQTLADVTLPAGWSWMNNTESVGDASTTAKIFKAKFTPTDTANYKTVENIDVSVAVGKADAPALADIAVSQKYTVTTEQSKDIGNGGMPADAGTLTYSEGAPALLTGSVAIDSASLDATTGKVTYKLSGGAAGDTVTLPVIIESANYADATVNVVITLTAKDDQAALTLTGGTTVVYGQTLQLGTSGGSGTGAVTYAVTNGTGEATIDTTGKLTPVKVGTVKVKATKAEDANYNAITSAEVEITIKQATSTGEPKYTAITTSGKTLADAGLTTTGSTLNPNAGTLVWVDNAGNVLPGTTTVEANTTYKWRFTPADANYTTLTGSIELYHKSTSSGGGGSYYAPVVPDMPMLYRGCTGDAVKTLQDKLNTLGYNSGNVDGIFGAKTYAAVTAFQKANGLGVDGIVGKLTWGKLYGVSPAMPVETTTVVGRPMVSYGSRGDAVRKLQELLNALGYDCGSVDGIFGSKTKAAVLAFQKANGLGADGIVGPLTWAKLG